MTPQSQFTITEISAATFAAANDMRLQSWFDTYVNDSIGVTREWIEERNQTQSSDEYRARRLASFAESNRAGWVALDSDGRVVGSAMPYVDDDGAQRVGSLYVEKSWHGKGVGGALMQKIIEWHDSAKSIELEVATYNDRARAFYRKWGFREVEGSERMHGDMIPVIKTVRAASEVGEQMTGETMCAKKKRSV